MNKLLELGLVEPIEHGKQKKYKAVAPNQIEKLARHKIIEAEDIVRELNTFSTIGHEQDFEVVQGERAIQKFEVERARSAPPETTQYFIGGGSEHFLRIMDEAYPEYAALIKERKIASQYIGAEHEAQMAQFYDKEQKKFEFRVLTNLPKGLVNVMIMNETLSFYTYANPPILYVVKSKLIAESYKRFFDMLKGRDVLYSPLSASERDHVVFLPTFGVIPITSHSARTLCLKSARRTSVIETRLPTFLGSLAPFNAPAPFTLTATHLGGLRCFMWN
ncbi:hypothetical protein HYT04_02455 [Candidatus Kaiserbacteria bacterium]|nr:hypothetical protein [Candidatus Kaiserbacteria bacterium]